MTLETLRQLGLSAVELLSVIVAFVCYREMKFWQSKYTALAEQTLETEVAIAVELGIDLPKRKE